MKPFRSDWDSWGRHPELGHGQTIWRHSRHCGVAKKNSKFFPNTLGVVWQAMVAQLRMHRTCVDAGGRHQETVQATQQLAPLQPIIPPSQLKPALGKQIITLSQRTA